MAIEKIESTFVVNGSILEITPSVAIADNSLYTIKIKGVKSLDGSKTFPEKTFNVTTALSPMYCTLKSLSALVDSFGIPEENMLSYIRDASKYADFVAGGTAVKKGKTPSFAVEQFVRTKATLDCLLRACMNKSYSSGGTYTLGDATLEEATNSGSFKNMISTLRDELQKWQDAIRGYYNEGRVKPKATRIGLKSSSNSDVAHTTVDQILNDISRTMPEGSS